MTEPAGSPYRSAPRTELEVAAGSNVVTMLAALGLAAVFYALQGFFGLREVFVWVPVLLAIACALPIALYTSRRNRWRFTLERQRLRVARVLPTGSRSLGTLDVSSGVKLRVDVPEHLAGVEARLTLDASGEEICFYPGARTRLVYEELSRFLREAEIDVDAPRDLPELPGEKLGLPKL